MPHLWIDLANSPQVLFFQPLLKELEKQQCQVSVTVRDFSQTVALADQAGLRYQKIGSLDTGKKGLRYKSTHLLGRVIGLWRFARHHHPDLAISHNSYSQAVAARLAGVPVVTIMDYEHQPANHLNFRLARRVIVPACFPDESLRRYGAANSKSYKYPGVKEQIYLSFFRPNPDFRKTLDMDPERVLVTVRPPGSTALYHRFENTLFGQLLVLLGAQDHVSVILLPRTPQQRKELLPWLAPNIRLPETVLDGPNLIYHSDLVISAGGTMNREAAVLGTPAYTIFQGPPAAADEYLIQAGRMVPLRTDEDLARIRLEKKHETERMWGNPGLVEEIVEAILGTLR